MRNMSSGVGRVRRRSPDPKLHTHPPTFRRLPLVRARRRRRQQQGLLLSPQWVGRLVVVALHELYRRFRAAPARAAAGRGGLELLALLRLPVVLPALPRGQQLEVLGAGVGAVDL